jgi:hypothetical protein
MHFAVWRYRGAATIAAMTTKLEVEFTCDVRPPVEDPTLGIEVAQLARVEAAAHRLVTLGDSLTHGFHHFSIFNSRLSWPATVAYQLGVPFQLPVHDGPGGHPLNLEWVARRLHKNPLQSAFDIWRLMKQVEEYYETGPGAVFPDPLGPVNENLAVWGWDLRDALARTADSEQAHIAPAKDKLVPLVSSSGQRAAVTVLNSARDRHGKALTPFQAARKLGDDPGGIETLCVWLGSNNVLSSVVSLEVIPSGPDYQDLEKKSEYTVWTLEHFTTELDLVVEEVRQVTAQHVLWATIPHVTIPPITHGLGGSLAECPRYFNYYARPWQTEQTFNKSLDRHITGRDAWAIDIIIDGYNEALLSQVKRARHDGLDWRVVDLCAVLDRLAVRRNFELNAPPDWWTPYPLPPELDGLDSRFFTTDSTGKRQAGGLIGLDGVHPTTAGYGIVASEFITVMAQSGVSFSAGPDGAAVDFGRVLSQDTLVSDPPKRIGDAVSLLRNVDHYADIFQRLLGGKLPF